MQYLKTIAQGSGIPAGSGSVWIARARGHYKDSLLSQIEACHDETGTAALGSEFEHHAASARKPQLKSPLSAGGAIEPSGRAFEPLGSGAQPLAVVEGGWDRNGGRNKISLTAQAAAEIGAGQWDGGIATLAERPIT